MAESHTIFGHPLWCLRNVAEVQLGCSAREDIFPTNSYIKVQECSCALTNSYEAQASFQTKVFVSTKLVVLAASEFEPSVWVLDPPGRFQRHIDVSRKIEAKKFRISKDDKPS